MAALVCQFHQYGHCKFAERCDKTHTPVTCNSFPCLDNTCVKRHPRRCKHYDLYGRCMFAERCSFLHYSSSGRDVTGSDEIQEIVQMVSELREEVKTLRDEIDRLGKVSDAQLSDHSINQKHLLEMIKDLKEEFEVDRVIRGRSDNMDSSAQVTIPEEDSASGDNRPKVDSKEIVHLCEELVAARDVMTIRDALDGIATIVTTAEKLNEVDKVAIIVEECGGLDRIHQFQHHNREDIQQNAVRILGSFFPDEFKSDEEVAPRTINIKADEFKGNGPREHTGQKGGKNRRKDRSAAPGKYFATNDGTRKGYNGFGRGQT